MFERKLQPEKEIPERFKPVADYLNNCLINISTIMETSRLSDALEMESEDEGEIHLALLDLAEGKTASSIAFLDLMKERIIRERRGPEKDPRINTIDTLLTILKEVPN